MISQFEQRQQLRAAIDAARIAGAKDMDIERALQMELQVVLRAVDFGQSEGTVEQREQLRSAIDAARRWGVPSKDVTESARACRCFSIFQALAGAVSLLTATSQFYL